MNCTEFDNLYDEIITHISGTSQVFWISTLCLVSIFSLLMLVVGAKILRPAAAIVAGCAGIVLGYTVTSEMGEVKCEIKLITSAVFGFVLGLIASCLLRAGLFILGGAAFGAVAHYMFEVIPEDILPELFAFQNRNGLYWIVVGCAALTGSILALVLKKQFLRVATSMIGGSGMALSTYIVFEELLVPPVFVHPAILLSISIVTSLIGIYIQMYLARRKKRNRKEQSNKNIKKLIRETNEAEEAKNNKGKNIFKTGV